MRVLLFLLAACLNISCSASTKSPDRSIESYNPTSLEQPTEILPFKMVDNRIFIDVMVNGKGPFQFILDTGGSYAMELETARALNLNLHDPFPISGVGADEVLAYQTEVNSIQIGKSVFGSSSVIALPLSGVRDAIGFERFDGILGSEFFKEHVVKIDFQKSQLLVWPKEFNYQGAGEEAPIQFEGEQPLIEFSVDGFQGRFLVDTGDRFTVTVFPKFFKDHGLNHKYKKRIRTISGFGVGGPVWGQLFRLDSFRHASVILENFPVRLPREEDYSNDFSDGAIGNGLLKANNLLVDYPHKRFIFLEKNESTYQHYDRSGLWLTSDGKKVFVTNVVRNSSAWSSGVRKDDRIVEFNGNAVDSLTLPTIRSQLSDPQNLKVKMKILRGSKLRSVYVDLKDQL